MPPTHYRIICFHRFYCRPRPPAGPIVRPLCQHTFISVVLYPHVPRLDRCDNLFVQLFYTSDELCGPHEWWPHCECIDPSSGAHTQTHAHTRTRAHMCVRTCALACAYLRQTSSNSRRTQIGWARHGDGMLDVRSPFTLRCERQRRRRRLRRRNAFATKCICVYDVVFVVFSLSVCGWARGHACMPGCWRPTSDVPYLGAKRVYSALCALCTDKTSWKTPTTYSWIAFCDRNCWCERAGGEA